MTLFYLTVNVYISFQSNNYFNMAHEILKPLSDEELKVRVGEFVNSFIDLNKKNKASLDERINEIQAQINVSSAEYDKKRLQERLAKLAGGVAIIKVGAATESELKEKKLRIEDALNATKAAILESPIYCNCS